MVSRAGRPPKVVVEGNEFSVKVKGQQYQFRKGEDGRLRRIGPVTTTTDTSSEDYEYAKAQVVKQAV